MLEKNKDYVEMRVSSTDCAFTQNEPPSICIDGYVYTSYMNLPDPGEFYILISKEKFEKMQADVNINAEIAKQWEINYDLLLKKIGFDTVESLVFYLTNVAECDTLQEAISKLKDQVKYTCDEWYSANSRNDSWKAAAECNSPKELIEKLNLLRDDISGHDTVIESYERNIKKWQKATGCSTPEQAKERIKALNERIDESEADYNHLLCTTGFESEGEIEDALDKCDHSTLRKALVDYEFDYENLLKLTGYKTEQDIRVALNDSEQFVYKDMRELINSLKRKDKFTESNWQGVTGFSTPEKCSSYIDRLEKKLEDIKNLTEED